jgi:hypothetical protein
MSAYWLRAPANCVDLACGKLLVHFYRTVMRKLSRLTEVFDSDQRAA